MPTTATGSSPQMPHTEASFHGKSLNPNERAFNRNLNVEDLGMPPRSSSISPRTKPQENEGLEEHEDLSPNHSIPSGDEADSIHHFLAQSWHPDSQVPKSAQVPQYKSASIAIPEASRQPLTRSVSQPAVPMRHARRASDNSVSNFNRFTKNYIIPAAKWAYSPISGSSKSKKKTQQCEYQIEYSVFKPLKHLRPVKTHKDFIIHWRTIVEDETGQQFDYPENYLGQHDFNNLVNSITDVIEIEHLFPQRIAAGSSGSYFIENRKLVAPGQTRVYKAGVFKPKDEEPYGPLSPKWTKWLHRTFFPCFFGRSCLIPNLGYISEAAACVLDRQLLSYIVPYTDVIYLRSPTFYYSYFDRASTVMKLPRKIGSFQVFLNGYSEAIAWFRRFPVPQDVTILPANLNITVGANELDLDSRFVWSTASLQQFREELEKLVILDYIMRNTDRGLDNWMIKIVWKTILEEGDEKTLTPVIRIGAIDSGLAFPWKQPDEWRSFPFGWLFLPLSIIGQPFSLRTRNHYLPLLTSKQWWELTVTNLRKVFEMDNDFKERLWLRQVAVLKGQAFNVVEILKLSYAGPLELTRRENLEIIDDINHLPDLVNNDSLLRAMKSSVYELGIGEHGYSPYNKNSDEEVTPVATTTHNETEPLLGHSSSAPHSQRYLEPIGEDNLSNNKNVDSLPEGDVFADSNGISGHHYGHETNLKNQGVTGFEYNLSKHDQHTDHSHVGRRVVIERLVKADSKPPVFTWC